MKCLHCGGEKFFEGPFGGMSVNVLCANPNCRHWFNWNPIQNKLEDLNKVESTQEQKVQESLDKARKRLEAKERRYNEGYQAFQEGLSVNTLRSDGAYGGYAESEWNIDRIAGFLDAMSDHIRKEKI